MNHLRIILDKSVVYGLSNLQVESLDRYFFQIIPPILQNEILADLTKEAEEPTALSRIAGNSYRISGNRGLTPNYHHLLANSLLGFEIPMDGKYLPAGESAIRSENGKLGLRIDTPLEDETIVRWERKDFWAGRKRMGCTLATTGRTTVNAETLPPQNRRGRIGVCSSAQ